ncbi:MAG: Threonine-tRNA ligase, partial [Microgenomates group bacterium GW2011_GWA2_47_8]
FDMGKWKISEEDFPKIEAKMREILPMWQKFSFNEVSLAEAKRLFKDNKYKVEMAVEFAKEGKKLMTNDPGDFLDLCKMGHVENPSKELTHFKLLSVAGAYWRGSEKNKMLTRIYGTCFPTKEELDHYIWQQEEAKKRDHRRLGKDLDLFSTNQLTGPGLILWHPKLATTRIIVEDFWRREHIKRGYQMVFTPHIASMDMFVISRHYSKYINSMFPAMLHEYIEGESRPDYQTDEQLKPMNCPNHIQIYQSKPRSYRELPIEMGELGTVYRYERAGTLHGMTRVRGFTQDDSHIFCRPDQVIDEIREVLELTKHMYDIFGFKDYQAYLSTRPEKSLGSDSMWKSAEESLKKALLLEGIKNFKIDEGAGVFYGPKIDSKIKDSLGREWQLGTIQFDFNMPDKAATTNQDIEEFWAMKTFKDKFKTKENLSRYLKKLGRGFDVQYVDGSGEKKQAVMIHRTVLGSMERFFGILIEHYGGAFPVWLSPVQVTLIPIAQRHNDQAQKALTALKAAGIRAEIDDRNESMQAKVRDGALQKVPYMGIMGDREAVEGTISIRSRRGEDLKGISLEQFIRRVHEEIERKAT